MTNTAQREPFALSIADTAKMLGVSRPTVYKLCAQDEFPSFRIGGRLLVSSEGLRRWVEKQVVGGERCGL